MTIVRQWKWYWPVVLMLLLVADRLTKSFFLLNPDHMISVIPQWITLHFFLNQVMALSLPLIPLLYYTFTFLALALLSYSVAQSWVRGQADLFMISSVIVLGGVSNLFDRWYYHGVIDFIQAVVIPGYSHTIFNLADVYVVVGIVAWAIKVLWYDKKVSTHN